MLQIDHRSIPLRVFWKDTDLRYLGCNRFLRTTPERRSSRSPGQDDFAFGWRTSKPRNYRRDDMEVMRAGLPKMGILSRRPAGRRYDLAQDEQGAAA